VEDELVNRVTWKIPNALALVGSRSGDEWNAMTTSWITQVAQEPVLIGVGVDKEALTHRLIAEGGSFTVNLWDADNTRPFVKFSIPASKEGMALNGWPITEGVTGAPIFDDAMSQFFVSGGINAIQPRACHGDGFAACVQCAMVTGRINPQSQSAGDDQAVLAE